MKTLFIIRHAKSSWDNPGISDFDRPLNDRGERDVPKMAKRLKDKKIIPDTMLSSPARRAFSTCKGIADVLKYPESKIKTEKALYHADAEEILHVVRSISDKFNVVFIIGHNPGLTDFVNDFRNDERNFIDNIPTCGIVGFKIKSEAWKDVNFREGEVLFFDYPKSKED